MKTVLHRRTAAEEAILWQTGIFVFDSSTLLNFYEFSESTRQDIYTTIFPLLKERLWITNQTEYEFLKNRERVMQKPNELYKDIQEQHFPAKHFKPFLQHYEQLKNRTAKDSRHPYVSPETFAAFDRALSALQAEMTALEKDLQTVIGERVKEHGEQMAGDQLLGFFQVTDGFTFSQLMDVAKEGEFRYRNRIPPGYADQKEKGPLGIAQYGDLVIWKQIIALAERTRKPIVLIIDDVKDDWCHTETKDKSRIESPREELIKEMQDEGGVQFWAYSSEQFVYKAKEILKSTITEGVIEEVKQVMRNLRGPDIEQAVFEWAEEKYNVDETMWASKFWKKDTGADIIQTLDGVVFSIQIFTLLNKPRPKELFWDIEQAKLIKEKYTFEDNTVVFVTDGPAWAESAKRIAQDALTGFSVVAGYINGEGKFVDVLYGHTYFKWLKSLLFHPYVVDKMQQSFTSRGTWWLPHTTEKLSGTLTYEPGSGLVLEVAGYFGKTHVDPPSPSIIWGTVEGDQPVTLLHSTRIDGNETFTKFAVTILFRRHHFTSTTDIGFTDVCFGLFNLQEWIQPKGLRYESADPANSHDFNYRYRQPGAIPLAFGEGCTATIYFSGRPSSISHPRQVTITEHTEVHLHYEQPRPYKALIRELTILQQFITLMTFEQSYPTFITFSSPEFMTTREGEKSWPTRIECVFASPFYSARHGYQSASEQLVPFNEVATDAPAIIGRWHTLCHKVEPFIVLAFRLFEQKYLVHTGRFLDQVRAIEIFHRVMTEPPLKDKAAHDEFVARVCNNEELTEGEKEYLEEKLTFANAPSLKERIGDMYERYGNAVVKGLIRDKKRFVDQAAYHRNYYTHYSAKKNKELLGGFELQQVANQVMLVNFSAVLQELGVPYEAYAFGLNKHFMWIVGGRESA